MGGACYSRERDASENHGGYAHSSINDFRILRFWWHVGPILMHYNYQMMLSCGDPDDARFERLHMNYAPKAREIIENFGGIFVKAGQAISTRPELAPAAYVAELRKLQSDAPPACWQPICESLEEEFGSRVDQVFESIEQEPLGAASIGQAHRAMWHGRTVVVKVQYPGVREKIRADLTSIQLLCKMINPEALPVLKKVAEQFEKELDYEVEQKALANLHQAISSSSEFGRHVVVPAPIPELTKGKVIGMEYLPGGKLETALRERLEALGIKVEKSSLKDLLMQHAQDNASSEETVPSQDSSSGPSFLASTPTGSRFQRCGRAVVRLLGVDASFRIARTLSGIRLWCKHRCRGRAPPKDLRTLLRLVVQVHGFQIFFCPVFNADPHPGNILLLPDGRVGLIDFGFCTEVEPVAKRLLAKLLIALAEAPPCGVSQSADARVAQAMRDTGVKTEKNSDEVLALFPRLAFCKIQPQWLDKKYVAGIMTKDKIVDMPLHVIMAARCAGLMRGLCLGLQENVSVAEVWRPYAARWLQENDTTG